MRLKSLDRFLHLWMKRLKSRDERATDISSFDPGAVKNILLVSSTAIGDTLLSTPAIRAVRKRYPEARIIALFNEANKELFEDNPNIDGVVTYRNGYRAFFSTVRKLRSYGFDLALILHGNEPQATPMCYLSGARFIMKLPNRNDNRFLLSNREPVLTWDDLGHGINSRLMTVKLADVDPDGVRMELFLNGADVQGAGKFLEGKGGGPNDTLIGFQPGASTISRQWFAPRFAELGRRLLDRYPGAKIVLTGSPAEAPMCAGIAESIGNGAIVSAGQLKLREAAALIKRLNVLVTGDTGPMHMAIAVGTPVVALYAVADASKTGPYYDIERHRVIQKPRTCDPCVSKKCEYQKCMEAISVDEVYDAVNEVVGTGR